MNTPERGCGPLSPLHDEALTWAASLHRDQLRKNTSVPYIAHLVAGSSLVLEGGEGSLTASSDDDQAEERPSSRAGGSITLYDRNGHHIWAELNSEGSLVISGQDLRPPNGWEEYEYAFTILPEDSSLIGVALDGTHDDSVLQLLSANAGRIVPGVQSWLDSVGARYKFWNRIETDDG